MAYPYYKEPIMAESRLSIRIDGNTKKKADTVFRKLGLTMSMGINIYLNRVAQQQGIPFSLILPQHQEADTLGDAAKKAVHRAIRETRAKGQPVALYDAKRKRPYLEYPDGRKEYEFND
jgi:DNA-damage-inducible protein J